MYGLNKLRKTRDWAKSTPQGPTMIPQDLCRDKSPAYPKTEFFGSLLNPCSGKPAHWARKSTGAKPDVFSMIYGTTKVVP
jgi:hypothetical protein